MTDVTINGVPLVNPLDFDTYCRNTLFHMNVSDHGFGACPILVWADHLETAFELAVEYWDDHASGHFVNLDNEALRESADALGIEWNPEWDDSFTDSADFLRVLEHAECDLTQISHTTLRSGQYLPSHCWNGIECDDATTMQAFTASARVYFHEYGEVPRDYGRKVAPYNRAHKTGVTHG